MRGFGIKYHTKVNMLKINNRLKYLPALPT